MSSPTTEHLRYAQESRPSAALLSKRHTNSLCSKRRSVPPVQMSYDSVFCPLLCCGVAGCLLFISELRILLYIPLT